RELPINVSELELRVSENDSGFHRQRGSEAVNVEADLFEASCQFRPDDIGKPLTRDVFVMSRAVLDGRRETRFGKLSAALQTLGEGFSRECALGDILLESRACEISADNALDIDTIRAPCDHRPSPQRVLFGIRKHEGGNVGGDKMVR